MANLREAIMEHIKSKQKSLKPKQISSIEERLTQMASLFHTPNHPPYAAMIERAVLELKQKGGSTEKSISEFIKREYDDLPWAHTSLLKHHLALLSKQGEIIQTRGFRYTLRAAGSSLGGTKHHKKKWRCNFDKPRSKRLKLAVVVRSQKANGVQVTNDPSQENDQTSQVAENPVIEIEKVLNDVPQSPKQDGTNLLQLHDGGENDIRSGSNDKNIDPPLSVVTDGRDNQVGIEQLQQQDCQLNPNEDDMHEHLSPEVPPGFEFMGVEVSDSQEHSLASSLPSLNKEQERNGPPIPNAEKLKKDDLPRPRQQKHEKKEVRHKEGRGYDKMMEQREYVLALPHTEKGSSLSRDLSVQKERSGRQLKRWNRSLPNISHAVKVLSSSENSGKRPRVDTTTDVGKSLVVKKLPSEFTIITRRKAKLSSLPRQSGAQSQPVSVALCSSTDLFQDEGCNSQGVRHSARLLALLEQDKDMQLKKYQRRGRRPKGETSATFFDDIQKQRAEELPESLHYHIPKEKGSEAALSEDEFTPPNLEDHSEKEHRSEPSKPPRRRRPSNSTVVVNKGKGDQSSTREKLKKSSPCRAKKTHKKC